MKLYIDSADPLWLSPTASYVGECALALGLSPSAREKLVEALKICCGNVIRHAYEPGEPVQYQVEIGQENGTLVVSVVDQGLPFDASQLHSHLRELVDEVRLVRLGRQGKRLELRFALQASVGGQPQQGEQVSAMPVADEPITLRLAVDEDAIPIARCVYRCYGRSYGSEYLYQPQKLLSLWHAGLVTSVVAVNSSQEVIGHLCYWLDAAEDAVGESTDAVVDPRYRGRHLFDRLRAFLIEQIRAQGRLGMVSEAVAVHPYSQKAVIASGAIETGLMLGDLPSNLKFKGIEDTLPARQSCMLCYLRLNPEPKRQVFLPPGHEIMLRKIYARVGLDREFVVLPETLALESEGQLEVHLDQAWGEAALRVVRFGHGLETHFHSQLRRLLANGIPYIYAELPLGEPAVAACVKFLEGMGFSFAGSVPELAKGDILRLHYLTNVELDLKIVAVTDWGGEIRDYVLGQAGSDLGGSDG